MRSSMYVEVLSCAADIPSDAGHGFSNGIVVGVGKAGDRWTGTGNAPRAERRKGQASVAASDHRARRAGVFKCTRYAVRWENRAVRDRRNFDGLLPVPGLLAAAGQEPR